MKRSIIIGLLPVILVLISGALVAQTPVYSYSKFLFGAPHTLAAGVTSMNQTTGQVTVNGVDTRGPSIPFTWQWGDGNSNAGWFAQTHTYANHSRNYVLTIIANYNDGTKDTCHVLIGFMPVVYSLSDPIPDVEVSVPSTMPTLSSRHYSPPTGLVAFDDTYFQSISRSTLESILSLAAGVEMDLTNDDVYRYNGAFQEVMLRSPGFGGAYSLWFTDPVSFGVGETFLQGSIGYSSLFHEMGHNFSLNTPSGYYYGSRIDGNANAIFSETMAQIYQHAAAWVLLNSKTFRDIPDDLQLELSNSATSSIQYVRTCYDNYVAGGKLFHSWNDPGTSEDETFGTFMTLSYKFFQHAENSGMGCRAPLKRMLHLLQVWNPTLQGMYDQANNSAPADTFRATLMVTALSYAFKDDYRAEFRSLNFPISDNTYDLLLSMAGTVNTAPVLSRLLSDIDLSGCAEVYRVVLDSAPIFSDPDGDALDYTVASSDELVAITSLSHDTLHVYRGSPGHSKITVTASDGNGGLEHVAFLVSITPDCDGDGVLEDGDSSGSTIDKPCATGQTTNCDDNCPYVSNSSQTDSNHDGVGDACCCVGSRGNVNYVGIVDLSDLSALVSYLTGGGYVLPCPEEANVNGSGIVDLSDLSALVSYLTGGGYVLPNCS